MMMMMTAMTNDDGDDANDLIYKSAGWAPTACAVRANHCVQLTSSNQPTPKWYPWWWRLESDVSLLKLTNRHHYFYDLANIWNLTAESISCNNVTGQKSQQSNIFNNFSRSVFALMLPHPPSHLKPNVKRSRQKCRTAKTAKCKKLTGQPQPFLKCTLSPCAI